MLSSEDMSLAGRLPVARSDAQLFVFLCHLSYLYLVLVQRMNNAHDGLSEIIKGAKRSPYPPDRTWFPRLPISS